MDLRDPQDQRAHHRWLACALIVASLYSALALHAAFAAPQLVQDDARQHVFWAERFRDPTLFPNDLIADYFQAVAPTGYKAIYWTFAHLGVDPLLLSRILPALIGLAVAWLAFRLFSRLTNDGFASLIAALFVCQVVWSKDDIVSATPRAFAYPLLLGFLNAFVGRRVLLALIIVALEALIYPQIAFVCAGTLMLGIFRWQDRQLRRSRDRHDYWVALAALVIVAAAVAPFAHAVAPYGPAMTRSEAVTLPEFQLHGRMQTFVPAIDYWLTSAPTGLLPTSLPVHIAILAVIGVVLVFVRKKFSSLAWIDEDPGFFIRLLITAVALWAVAHAMLFRLHLPARYSQYALRIVIPLFAVLPLQLVLRKLRDPNNRSRAAVLGIAVVLLAVAPFTAKKFPNAEYVAPRSAGLDAFLETQPKATLIATLRPMASTIPVFAHRSVLVSAEHAIAYHAGYYHQIRQRGRDLVQAHLTSDPHQLRAFIDRYHVDLFVVPRDPITATDIANLRWYREITRGDPVDSGRPALRAFVDSAKVWENDTDIVLDAHRIVRTIAAHETTSLP